MESEWESEWESERDVEPSGALLLLVLLGAVGTEDRVDGDDSWRRGWVVCVEGGRVRGIERWECRDRGLGESDARLTFPIVCRGLR